MAPEAAAIPRSASVPGRRVLVLDDEDRVREILVEILAAAGYTVAGLARAAEALARFDELQPDLIVLDMMMPGMDGFEFLARLRMHPAGTNVPVLINSVLGKTLARSLDEGATRSLGVAGIRSKSGTIEALVEEVRRILGCGAPGAGESGRNAPADPSPPPVNPQARRP